MKLLIAKIKRFFLRLFTKRPKHKLAWTVEDFQAAKKWAKTQPHPRDPKLTYWDYLNSPWHDSVEILAAVNQILHVDPMFEDDEEVYTFI
jgi:hypothetical protein